MLEASYEVEATFEEAFADVAWTDAEDARLAELVAGSSELGRSAQRWEYVAQSLGNGRTVADVRARWADLQQRPPAPAPEPEPEPTPEQELGSVDGAPPSGWSGDACRQLGWMVIDEQRKGTGAGEQRKGAALWEHIASSLVGGRTGRDCRAVWLECLQPEPGAAFERAVGSAVPSAREVAGEGWTGRGYTLYCIDTRTAIGRLGIEGEVRTERRFSEFEAFHAAVVSPLLATAKLQSAWQGLPPLTLPDKALSKNDPTTVQTRRAALQAYLGAALALGKRMASPALDRALLHFLAARPGSPPVLPGHDSGSGLWDAAGSWAFHHSVSFHGTACSVPHTLALLPDGQCHFSAAGHPAGGKVTYLATRLPLFPMLRRTVRALLSVVGAAFRWRPRASGSPCPPTTSFFLHTRRLRNLRKDGRFAL